MSLDDARAAYDQAAGVAARQEQISYFKEMVFSGPSKFGLGGTALLALVLAVTTGLGFAALPILFWGMLGTLATLFVPSSPVFQEFVQRRKRAETRERVRAQLLSRLVNEGAFAEESSVDPLLDAFVTRNVDLASLDWHAGLQQYRQSYMQMRERLGAMMRLASDSSSSLSRYDLEKLDDVTIDFLRLVTARVALRSRMGSQRDAEIDTQLRQIESQIQETASSAVRARLAKAQSSLEGIQKRRRELPARETALTAQLIAMGETFEELYHRVTSNPNAGSLSGFLSDATERLSIEEELQVVTMSELDTGDGMQERMRAVAEKARAKQEQQGQ